MKMVLYLIIILNNGNDYKLHQITSNEILSCSKWIEKNIIYKYTEEEGYSSKYKDTYIAGYICEKGEL
tara:strand:+ start:582 stop:785 length:204 start_codon:yes stop_codon:yes gene_type:complete